MKIILLIYLKTNLFFVNATKLLVAKLGSKIT